MPFRTIQSPRRLNAARPPALLRSLLSLLHGRIELRLVPRVPPTHDKIARIGIALLLLRDATAYLLHELDVDGPSKAAGDLVLRLSEVGAVRLEAVGPDMRGAFRIDELDIHLNLVTGSPHATFDDIAHT